VGRTTGVCPFGFGFRPAMHDAGNPPFCTWEYRPPYLPPSLSFSVATNAGVLTEPMLFYLAFARRPDTYPATKRQPFEHAAGLREITRLQLFSPHAGDPSPEVKAVMKADLVRLRGGPEYLVELGFDGETQGKAADFRPALPLVFHW
jgi:hypothetical protein